MLYKDFFLHPYCTGIKLIPVSRKLLLMFVIISENIAGLESRKYSKKNC